MMKKSTNASTEAQLITPAALTDEQRGLIERAEDRLRGRGAEDADAANGLLEVLIAHPARPIAHDETAQPEKSCADAPYGNAEKAEDMRMIKLVLDDYTRNGIATMTESEKVSYLSASLLSAYQLLRSVVGDEWVMGWLEAALHEVMTTPCAVEIRKPS
ncbi:hypothetical protein ACGY1D_16725 [Burkholderia pseudomallei]|uniref:hypothetical protein n=1 Tax=Burkholderia pseudomallei TaxID=28450 RepID=UPI0003A66146|nr:hypothetical protein [Burkholderia pseudomallei]MDV2105543.1 hypothetical protein [Burkholderia pseudomallei]MDV2202749.1 hypothetical protein [Burkholderia pseudomallei]MDV2234751.1 hypothetical protein [Burkholderia pseudomallei]OAG63288.1 hypothetical protein BIM11_4023 [Burkholderia pseudomallei]CAJ8441572.1 gp44 [Burkholderia pseudomallei]